VNALKTLARPFSALEGQVVFYMMPYTTLRWQILLKAFAEIVPRDDWEYAESIFVLFEGNIVDMEFAWNEQATSQSRAYEVYWQGRTGNVAQDWALFLSVFAPDALAVLSQAYDATRDTVLVNPNGASEDPEALASTATGL